MVIRRDAQLVDYARMPSTSQVMLDSSLSSASTSHPRPSSLLQPLSASATNGSQMSFILPEVGGFAGFAESLPPEIASADISIALDGTFVETSSGAAARELKRRYDQYFGVGKDVRSPYAITAFVNQHGKQMYRVSHRELSAPAASAPQLEFGTKHNSVPRTTQRSQVSSQQSHRRSRMSVHSFLPGSVFKNGSPLGSDVPVATDGTRSPPIRKLRKTRSIPSSLGPGPDASASTSGSQRQSVGRPHAHSVSSVDAFRLPPQETDRVSEERPLQKDIFADVLSHENTISPPFSSSAASQSSRSFRLPTASSSKDSFTDDGLQETIVHPFGTGVSFDSPSWRAAPQFLAPTLREMQSFESGLTARAEPQTKIFRTDKPHIRAIDEEPVSPHSDDAHGQVATGSQPSMYSRYPTELFDVLQNYRGLPALDKISSTSTETTIKLSLKADNSAAPRDDPRFVIWGDIDPHDVQDFVPGSSTDVSSSHSAASRRKSTRDGTTSDHTSASSMSRSREASEKLLIAATIERWLAQLTSELDYDELLIFFLTYRTYISAVDLGHLFICRFQWALSEPSSPRDEMVRRIVRVRTFTAIRYWLVTFFHADFVPNRELRLLFANWLNSLRKDPFLQTRKDALKIVGQLRKVASDCKDAYLRKAKDIAPSASKPRSSGSYSVDAATSTPLQDDDSDLDLDFDVGDSSVHDFSISPPSSVNDAANAAGLAMLQPLHRAVLQYGKQHPSIIASNGHTLDTHLPAPHGALSRVFVNTIGRLGRWKRVLNSRSPGRIPLSPYVDVSAFDVEASETGDILTVRGGVEQYLKTVENQIAQASFEIERRRSPLRPPPSPPPRQSDDMVSLQSTDNPDSTVYDEDDDDAETAVRTPIVLEHHPPPTDKDKVNSDLDHRDSQTLSEISVSETETSTMSDPKLEVVSIDDLDFSDFSDDGALEPASPPGLKRALRKLPTRREFEFVRNSVGSASSMGIRTRESLMSAGSSSAVSSISTTSGDLAGGIHQWQVNALVESLSDDDESGDVEDALRRLEGQINQDKQRAKQSKVDRWIQSIQGRNTTARLGFPPSNDSHDSSDEDYGEVTQPTPQDSLGETESRESISVVSASGKSSRSSIISVIPAPSSALSAGSAPGRPAVAASVASDTPSKDGKSDIEEVVPLEILQSRVTNDDPAPSIPPPTLSPKVLNFPLSSKGAPSKQWKWHQSFILNYRSETLVQHLSMIDRELFLNIRFEELMSHRLSIATDVADILDWGQFLRERARLKAEGRAQHKTDSLIVVRSRFNLVARFVLSEVVLTHPSQRAVVFGKFVRMAWKAHESKSFTTLVAIIAGLRSDWATRAMRQCTHKVGMWEQRMLRDLVEWTTSDKDFKHIRRAVDSLVESKPFPTTVPEAAATSENASSVARNRAISEGKPPTLPSCIPFFGVYLSQLYRYSELPDLIDPTAPHEPVGIDPLTHVFSSPAHPEVFATLSPLPPSMQLEPLINVHKQRLIAGVIKSLVAGQHLASRVHYPLDKKLFQKCLKLRGLDSDTLERALKLYSDMR